MRDKLERHNILVSFLESATFVTAFSATRFLCCEKITDHWTTAGPTTMRMSKIYWVNSRPQRFRFCLTWITQGWELRNVWSMLEPCLVTRNFIKKVESVGFARFVRKCARKIPEPQMQKFWVGEASSYKNKEIQTESRLSAGTATTTHF